MKDGRSRVAVGLALGCAVVVAGSALGAFAHESPTYASVYFGHMKYAQAGWGYEEADGTQVQLDVFANTTRKVGADAEVEQQDVGGGSEQITEAFLRREVCGSMGCGDTMWAVKPGTSVTFTVSEDLEQAVLAGTLYEWDFENYTTPCEVNITWTGDGSLGTTSDHASQGSPDHFVVKGSAGVSRPAVATVETFCESSPPGAGFGGIGAAIGTNDHGGQVVTPTVPL